MVFPAARTAALRNAASSWRSGVVSRPFSTSSSPASLSSLFSWFSGKTSVASTNDVSASSTPTSAPASDRKSASTAPSSATTSPSPSSRATPAPVVAASSNPTETPEKHAKAAPMQGKMLARDQELLSKLLDREGGSAGVSIVNGRYEEGLGPETKKNMFRLI